MARRVALTAALGVTLVLGCSVSANAFWSQVFAGTAAVQGDVKVELLAVGPATALAPGDTETIAVSVRNASAAAVRLTDAVIRKAADGDGPVASCPAEYLAVDLASVSPVVLAPRSKASVMLRLRLAPDAPTGCQGARVPLRITMTVGAG